MDTELKELHKLIHSSSGATGSRPSAKILMALQRPHLVHKMTDTEKIVEMEAVMRKHFADVRIVHSDHVNEKASFVQVGTPKI